MLLHKGNLQYMTFYVRALEKWHMRIASMLGRFGDDMVCDSLDGKHGYNGSSLVFNMLTLCCTWQGQDSVEKDAGGYTITWCWKQRCPFSIYHPRYSGNTTSWSSYLTTRIRIVTNKVIVSFKIQFQSVTEHAITTFTKAAIIIITAQVFWCIPQRYQRRVEWWIRIWHGG